MSELSTGNQLLRDPNIQPTSEIIAHGLGEANIAFIKFLDALKEYDISLMEWRYYNDGKAWLSKGEHKWTTARGTNKVKLLFWLSIWDGFFKIAFYFSSDIMEELLSLPISKEAKEIIINAKPMGKTMRFIPIVLDIASDLQLSDIYELAQLEKLRLNRL